MARRPPRPLPSPGSCASAAGGLALLVTITLSALFLGFTGISVVAEGQKGHTPLSLGAREGRKQLSIFSQEKASRSRAAVGRIRRFIREGCLGGRWERRRARAALPGGGRKEKGSLPASPLQPLGCTLGEPPPHRATGQMPVTASLRDPPLPSAPRPSGCRQPCASASAGPGTPCGGEGCGALLQGGAPTARAGHSGTTSILGAKQ